MSTIAQWLAYGQKRLSFLENSRLESQILLAHALKCERAYFYTWPEKVMDARQIAAFVALIKRREQGEPVAYLLEQKEFWSQPFRVTPDTLIPRPETELLIEKVLEILPAKPLKVVDIGTGSGIIACTLALMRPQWQITAIDICSRALSIGQHNALKLGLKNLTFILSDWLQAVGEVRFNAIVSNPPYLKETDPHLVDLAYEPRTALVSGPTGLEAFETIIAQANSYLMPGGYLAFEHGYEQGSALRHLMARAQFTQISTTYDLAGCERVSIGKQKIKTVGD